jgi:hypothetical protein
MNHVVVHQECTRLTKLDKLIHRFNQIIAITNSHAFKIKLIVEEQNNDILITQGIKNMRRLHIDIIPTQIKTPACILSAHLFSVYLQLNMNVIPVVLPKFSIRICLQILEE